MPQYSNQGVTVFICKFCGAGVVSPRQLRAHENERCQYNPALNIEPHLYDPLPQRHQELDHPIPQHRASSSPANRPSPDPSEPGAPPPHEAPMPRVSRIHGTDNYIARHPYLYGQTYDDQNEEVKGPPTPQEVDRNDYFPFQNEQEYTFARWIFRKAKLSNASLDELMEILESLFPDNSIPWKDFNDFYATIDSIPVGGVPWTESTVKYDGEMPVNPPAWMTQNYHFWFRDPLEVMEEQLANPEFASHVDYAPKRMYTKKDGATKREYRDLMSGEWSWEQADILAANPGNHGAMFAPIVLGSDKTTVSVATGQNEYYPLYASLGNLHNHARRAHREGVAVIGFLAIPKTEKRHQNSPAFRKFRRQLMHSCLVRILSSLKPWMEVPKLTLCGDGHYRRVIYGIGPYIGDYPEHSLLSGIVYGWCPKCTASNKDLDSDPGAIPRSHTHTSLAFHAADGQLKTLWDDYGIVADVQLFTSHFPRADIHELVSPDLLHQAIKGVFKDHLITWIVQWMEKQKKGAELRDELDRRIAAAPGFTALRRFPQGRDFKQWTGNDSKALMKVIVPALRGLVPDGMVRAVSTFLDFCYIARRSVLTETDLNTLDELLVTFHQEREVFREHGIRTNFDLPRQHALQHYSSLIRRFGAPNGLCASITESKHIDAVKDPYRRTNRNEPMAQMLTINDRNARMQALEQYFIKHDMLTKPFRDPLLPEMADDPIADDEHEDIDEVEDFEAGAEVDMDDEGNQYQSMFKQRLATLPRRPDPTGYSSSLDLFKTEIGHPQLGEYIRRFLYDELNPDTDVNGWDVELNRCPHINPQLHIKTFYRARVSYFSPSEPSNLRGWCSEIIRALPNWKGGGARHDCVFIHDFSNSKPGFAGLQVAQVHIFFSFEREGKTYPCALVRWFVRVNEEPSPVTRMWEVAPLLDDGGNQVYSVEHLDVILRAAHLIGVYGEDFLPANFTVDQALHAFRKYHVNKFVDHHAHETAF